MGKLIQLKGENFLGLGKLKEKIFPITKPEAVIDDNGVNMKKSLDTVKEDITNLQKNTFEVDFYNPKQADLRVSEIINNFNGSNLLVDVLAYLSNLIIDINPIYQIQLLIKTNSDFAITFDVPGMMWYTMNCNTTFDPNITYLITIYGNIVKCEDVKND